MNSVQCDLFLAWGWQLYLLSSYYQQGGGFAPGKKHKYMVKAWDYWAGMGLTGPGCWVLLFLPGHSVQGTDDTHWGPGCGQRALVTLCRETLPCDPRTGTGNMAWQPLNQWPPKPAIDHHQLAYHSACSVLP